MKGNSIDTKRLVEEQIDIVEFLSSVGKTSGVTM